MGDYYVIKRIESIWLIVLTRIIYWLVTIFFFFYISGACLYERLLCN